MPSRLLRRLPGDALVGAGQLGDNAALEEAERLASSGYSRHVSRT